MATSRDWAIGYYRQAAADTRAARILLGVEPSVAAMLLQMALEKLGKAALLRSGQITVERARSTHAAAGNMVQQLGRNPRACARLGYHPAAVRYHLAPLVDRLERSHPSFALGGPHLEYPWETPAGEIQWPAQHLDVARAFRPRGSYGAKLLIFAEQLRDRFDEVFP